MIGAARNSNYRTDRLSVYLASILLTIVLYAHAYVCINVNIFTLYYDKDLFTFLQTLLTIPLSFQIER